MHHKLITLGFVLSFAHAAHAQCTNQVTTLSMVAGGSPQHVTVVNTQNCAQVGPAGVTFQGANAETVTPDATGFVITPVSPTSGDTVCAVFSGATPGCIKVTITPAATLGFTSP